MRHAAALAALVAPALACSSKPAADRIDAAVIDAPAGPPDAPGPPADARVLPDAAIAACAPTAGTTLTTRSIATGLASPVYVTAPPGDKRLFVVEQPGRIRIIEDEQLLAAPFLDLSGAGGPVNATGNEQGLLGLAFHPDYAHNGRFYVQYTGSDNAVNLVEYQVSGDPYRALPGSARLVLQVPHPGQENHNAGTIEFGPDGLLYFSLGDGGGGGDTSDNAQNTTRLLGKILRLDVDTRTGTKAYGIPPGNPYASSPDGPDDPRPEVWSYGWRNPYRWDFDPTTGDLIVADVGQGLVEEVDIIPAGTGGGENFGWHTWEGDSCFSAPCAATGFHDPVVDHPHSDGWCAIIGGSTYRGSCFPDLQGMYFYTDYCKHELWTFTPTGGAAVGDRALTVTGFPTSPTSLHTDATGELYVTGRDGSVRHIIVAP